MSTSVLPSFGNGTNKQPIYPWKRSPKFSTKKQTAISGKRTTIANWNTPLYTWSLSYSLLRQGTVRGAAYTDYATFEGFFETLKGAQDSFLYSDSDDNSVTGQAIATGTGALNAFQLQRTFGGATIPILAPNTVSAVKLAGVAIPNGGLAVPGTPGLSSSSAGALGATTYFVKTTWVTNSGETVGSAEASLAVAANKVLGVAAPTSPPTGAIGWNVYVSNTAGGGSTHETKQNGGTPIAIGTPWTEPTSGLVAGSALPGSNTTGWSVSTWGATTPGVLTFLGNVANAIAITADFTFYFPCQFDDDMLDFEKFQSNMFRLAKVSFTSLK